MKTSTVSQYAGFITNNGGLSQGRTCDTQESLCQWLENGEDSLAGGEVDMADALAEWLED